MKYLFLPLFFLSFVVFTNYTSAQLLSPDVDSSLVNQTEAMAIGSGFDESTSADSVPNTIALVIKAFLSLLGIILIILIIWAGYNWMTAGGNEEKISKATNTITRAMIGLTIALSAYAITYFVFNALDKAT